MKRIRYLKTFFIIKFLDNMIENHQIRNIRFRIAVNDFLDDIKSEAVLEKRIERLKRLKQEVGDIFSHEFLRANFEKIRNNLIRTQNYSVSISDKLIKNFFISQKQKYFESFRSYHLL